MIGVIANIIEEYCAKYKLLDWIPIDKIDWGFLSAHANAISLLEKNPDKIDWCGLSLNPNAIHLLEKNPNKINWYWLFENLSIFKLVKPNLHL